MSCRGKKVHPRFCEYHARQLDWVSREPRDLRPGQGRGASSRLHRAAGLSPAAGPGLDYRSRNRRCADGPAAPGPGQRSSGRRPLPTRDGGPGALQWGQGTTHGARRSGFYTRALVAVCREMEVRYSITIRQHQSLRNLIEAIPEEDWTPIPYWMDGAADVAETTYTPFQSEPDAAPVRLIVRRVKPTPGTQLALFAAYSYHGFITDRDGATLALEADHRRHAEIENAIRDLKYGVGLNHLPSGRFAANAAWLAVQVMAHNLARWTARIGLGEQLVTTKTLRRRFFSMAGRLTSSARRPLCIFPSGGPGKPSSVAPSLDCAPSHSQPDGASSPDPLTGQPIVPANSHQLGPRGTLPAYRMSNSARHGRTAAIIVPVWLPSRPLIPIYWNLARPVRLPLPIIPGINDRDVSLRWIRA